MAFWKMVPKARIAVAASLWLAAGPGGAAAQSMSTNAASYNAGYGRYSGQENRVVDVGSRDLSGNRQIINGAIQTGVETVASKVASGGAVDAFSGVGGGSSLAVGNSLNVVTTGSYNTVIVNSTQINNGDVTAVSGGVGNAQ